MTMTESSPPPSPISQKQIARQDADPFTTSSVSKDDMSLPSHPTLSRSAINKSLYHTFPTPPQSPFSPSLQATSPRLPSPLTPTFARRQKPRVSGNHQGAFPRARRRSSLSASHTHIAQILGSDYGPPPHPAPTAPLPPIPGAPRVNFTTPAQERSRYSSYELYDKLRSLEKEQQSQEVRNKRHSAPPLKSHQSLPLPTPHRLYGQIQRAFSENAATEGGGASTVLGGPSRMPSIIPPRRRRRSSFKSEDMI